jgi:hypothetical protein
LQHATPAWQVIFLLVMAIFFQDAKFPWALSFG